MSKYIAESSDLTAVADAIRTKGGTSAQLAFPSGFVSAIGDIPTGGGGYSVDDIADGEPSGAITITTPTIVKSAFYQNTKITSVTTNGTTRINDNAFSYCTGLVTANLTGVTHVQPMAFAYCTNLETLNVEDLVTVSSQAFRDCPNLSNTLRFVNLTGGSGNSCFFGDKKIQTVYFYKTVNISFFSGFFSGCTGITDIYVPWSNGAVSGAPWGATNATIHYDTTY